MAAQRYYGKELPVMLLQDSRQRQTATCVQGNFVTSGEIAIWVVYLYRRYLLETQDVTRVQTLHSWPQCKHFYFSHPPEENNDLCQVKL